MRVPGHNAYIQSMNSTYDDNDALTMQSKHTRKQKEDDMSITLNLYYTGENGNARKFAEEMESSGVAGAIRAEAGNEKYAYFFPMDDPETVLLIDSWKDQEAIDVHHASPMMGEIARLREKYDLHMKAERYVTDEAGISAHDAKFIKQ